MLAGWLSGCGINNIPTYDEQVKAAWSQVENQYQRRADLIPNLVETVKGYMKHEAGTLEAVTAARNQALAAAKAIAEYEDDPETIARKAMQVAADICVFTNGNVTVEEV